MGQEEVRAAAGVVVADLVVDAPTGTLCVRSRQNRRNGSSSAFHPHCNQARDTDRPHASSARRSNIAQ